MKSKKDAEKGSSIPLLIKSGKVHGFFLKFLILKDIPSGVKGDLVIIILEFLISASSIGWALSKGLLQIEEINIDHLSNSKFEGFKLEEINPNSLCSKYKGVRFFGGSTYMFKIFGSFIRYSRGPKAINRSKKSIISPISPISSEKSFDLSIKALETSVYTLTRSVTTS